MTRRGSNVMDTVLRFIEGHAEEQLQFLCELSRQNSYSWNKAGTDLVAGKILERIGSAFPHHRTVHQTDVGDLHLLSTVPAGGKSIYVLAHMDTVFPPEHPFGECWVDGDELHGPGTGDMKAGITTLVYAALALDHSGVLRDIPLTVMLVGDEEIGAITSRPVYEQERESALACLAVEGAGANGEVVLSRYGKIGARLDCAGIDQHVGAKSPIKASAVLELAHKVVGIENLNGIVPDSRLNVGTVEGGLSAATVPASASALVDVRWKDPENRDLLVEKMREVVSGESVRGCRSELSIVNERPAWPVTPGARWLADLVTTAGREVGQEIGQESRIASSDSNFFGAAGIPTVDGMGPVCEGYHTAKEFVRISTIKKRTCLLANSLVTVAGALASGRPPVEDGG